MYNLMIDKYSGQVAYAVMSFGGFLGIGESYHPLPWKKPTYDPRLGGYVVDLDRRQLETARLLPPARRPTNLPTAPSGSASTSFFRMPPYETCESGGAIWPSFGWSFRLLRNFRIDHSEVMMDKDRVTGVAHQVKGAVKETVGKVTGDAKTQAEGAAEKAAGKVQNAVGGAKDAIREAGKR